MVDGCADVVLDDRLWASADLSAREPSNFTSQLTGGPLPACRLGNDPGEWRDHSLYEHGVGAVVESEVKYRGKDPSTGELLFDLVGDEGALGLPAMRDAAFTPEPGQSFWLHSVYWYYVLRESQTGPVVLAGGALAADGDSVDPAAAQLVGDWLGTTLSVESDCVYESVQGGYRRPNEPSHLFSVRLGDAPGVSIASGTTARVAIGGAPYDVWVSTVQSNVPLTITRAQ